MLWRKQLKAVQVCINLARTQLRLRHDHAVRYDTIRYEMLFERALESHHE